MKTVLPVLILSLLVAPVADAQVGDADVGFLGFDGTISPSALFASPVQPALALGTAGMGADDEKESGMDYLALRVGPLWFTGDLDSLDTGVSTEIAFGYRFIRILSVELQSGGFWAEDPDGSTTVDLFGIPIAVNARVTIPILFLHLFAGLGLGGYYVDAEVETGGNSTDDDDFVFGASLFAGTSFNLGPVSAGVEFKYVMTDDADFKGQKFDLDYFAFLITGGWRF